MAALAIKQPWITDPSPKTPQPKRLVRKAKNRNEPKRKPLKRHRRPYGTPRHPQGEHA
jgi:hypothetical protein